MTDYDIAWLAGLLEGEGWFGSMPLRRNSPKIQVTMADQDVIEEAARVVGDIVGKPFRVTRLRDHEHRPGTSPMYRLSVAGRSAEAVMLAVRPWMRSRRGGRIDDVLHFWYRTLRAAAA